MVVLRHSIEIYDVGQSKNQKVPPATSLQTLLVEEKKRGRGEEIAADKSLYFPPTNLEWGETLSMENIHEALSHSHSQSSAQSHFCSISFFCLSQLLKKTLWLTVLNKCHKSAFIQSIRCVPTP